MIVKVKSPELIALVESDELVRAIIAYRRKDKTCLMTTSAMLDLLDHYQLQLKYERINGVLHVLTAGVSK